MLGPNGAGKTTALRILTTLSVPDAGSARVAGHDVVGEATAVQREIGVTAQDATLDEVLTGRQNLMMVARLSGLDRRAARGRATELLERFDLRRVIELAEGTSAARGARGRRVTKFRSRPRGELGEEPGPAGGRRRSRPRRQSTRGP